MNTVISAWVGTDPIIAGTACKRLRWPAQAGGPTVEVQFAVGDESVARTNLLRAMTFADPTVAPILDFDVQGGVASVRYAVDADASLADRCGTLSMGDVVRLITSSSRASRPLTLRASSTRS